MNNTVRVFFGIAISKIIGRLEQENAKPKDLREEASVCCIVNELRQFIKFSSSLFSATKKAIDSVNSFLLRVRKFNQIILQLETV